MHRKVFEAVLSSRDEEVSKIIISRRMTVSLPAFSMQYNICSSTFNHFKRTLVPIN